MNTHPEIEALKMFFTDNNISLLGIQSVSHKFIVRFSVPQIQLFLNEKKTVAECIEIEIIFNSKDKNKKLQLYIVGLNHPFHPHFKNSRFLFCKKSKWIDYKKNDTNENIVDFVKRVLLSLQFDSDYVIPPGCAYKNIVNKKAGKWYLWEYKTNPFTFQIENFLKKTAAINESQNINISKKFEINESQKDTKKKFQIKETTIGYRPIEQEYSDFETENSLNALSNKKSDEFLIYITENAKLQLFSHIFWRQSTSENCNEQGGILVGNVFIDKEQKKQYAIVEQAIAGVSAKGGSAHLEIGHEVWKDMIDQVDALLEKNPEKKIQIIGWYHTHPNNLDVFMSGTDRNTQQLHFMQDWHYAIVLNPQKQIWKAFYSKDAKECSGFFIQNKENLE